MICEFMISTREVSPRTNTYHRSKEVYLVLLLQMFFKTIRALLNYDCMHKFLSFLHIHICLLLYDQEVLRGSSEVLHSVSVIAIRPIVLFIKNWAK